jgi:iron complex transport system ATP-binding protein
VSRVRAVTESPAASSHDRGAQAPGLLKLQRLEVAYGTRIAVTPTSLTLTAGEMVALVGPNGAGKSSLLKATAALLPRAGSVSWNGRALETLTARQRARLVAYLPQAPAAHWPMTVRDLVALGRLPHRALGEASGGDDREAIERAIRQTDTGALAQRRISELSGGERSRALLARALAVGAPVLLVDEPIASLDPYHQLQIMRVLESYASDGNLVIAVLHDLSLAARFCARMILMDEGRVVADGTPDAVLTRDTLRRHYRIDPYLARHEEQPVVVPWTQTE